MNNSKILLFLSFIISTSLPIHTTNHIFNKRNGFLFALLIPTIGAGIYKLENARYFKSLHWDWPSIDPTVITIKNSDRNTKNNLTTISIPEFFKLHTQKLKTVVEPLRAAAPQNDWLWGAATSAHQVEGNCTNNQWYLFEDKTLEGKNVEPARNGCDSWNHEDEDIQHLKELGLNTYRFSVEWSKIMPQPGVIDKEVLEHYKTFCKKLVANGIKPVITLYHYTEPIWFYELGGFEKRENNKHFVEFCTAVFEALHQEVYLWFTFNAPEGIALQGWLTGTKPPAKKNMQLAIEVLGNILEAHVQVYQAIKKMDGGPQSRIGILKNIMQLDPWNIFNPLDHLACSMGNLLQNECIYNFFTNGTFKVYIPAKVNMQHFNAEAPHSLDFIGLNYYCHNYMKNFKPIRELNQDIEIHANNDKYTIYGEGLYRAIAEISKRIAKPLHIPIYITENGIGIDNNESGNTKRILHNQRYLYALARAIQDGHDVRGYIHWSLMDNYEWGQYGKFYGLFHVDRNSPQLKRIKKDGASYYEWVVKESRLSI